LKVQGERDISIPEAGHIAEYGRSHGQVGSPKSHSRGLHSRENTIKSSDLQETPIIQRIPSDETPLQNRHGLPVAMPPKHIITEGIALYFQYCHKQPLWLFDPEDLAVPENCRSEVIFGILSLSLLYSDSLAREGRTDQMCRQYAEAARSYAMLRITQGKVNLSTLQSFCLIAMAEYIGKDIYQSGQYPFANSISQQMTPISQGFILGLRRISPSVQELTLSYTRANSPLS